MKRIVALVLSMLMIATCFIGCDKKDDGKQDDAGNKKVALTVLSDGGAEEQYVIGFRKGDVTLRDAFQKTLAEMKADGSLGQIATTWFGSDVTTVATTPTTLTESATDTSLEKVKTAGTLILGLDATFKPMGFTNEKDEIVGFDIDVAREACKRLGLKLELKGIDWATKEQTLDAGIIDCIWNGMSYDDKRAEAMNLSEAYMNNSMVYVVAENSGVKAASELSGKKIAVQSGSTAQTILEASDLGKSIEVVALETNVECLQQLRLGLVDAAFMDSVVANYEIQQEG